MLNDLRELIAIKSVLGTPEEGAPFGVGCREALDWFLAKADSYGLKTGEIDGYCGWAEYGEGKECVAALCHLDVVPEGEGWTSEPYTLSTAGGRLVGRGVADDKGAAIMCLHALKDIRDRGIRLNRRIRVIVGLNEEHGSACMKHYVKHGEIPTVSFVPDADFPVINSEKGILHLGVRIPLDKFFEENIAFIGGGKSINVIPDRAELSFFKQSKLAERLSALNGGKIDGGIFSLPEVVGSVLAAGSRIADFSVKAGADVYTVVASGTSGHAMAPQNADNAVWKLFAFLGSLAEKSAIAEFMNNYICLRNATEKLGIFREDEQSGDTTISLGIIEVDDKSLYFTLDIRLNITNNHEDVKKAILDALPPKSKIEVLRYAPNLFVDKDSDLIKTLLGVYTDITGLEPECLRCGGGTYARELPNAVAFGPAFPGRVTNLHKPDEVLLTEDFFKAAEVYKEAFIRLASK